MRASFSPGDITAFKNFFSQESSGFLDIYVTDRVLYVITSRRDLYAHRSFDILTKEDWEGPVMFRVDRKEFLGMLTEGTVTFLIINRRTVEVIFESQGFRLVMTRDYQESDKTSVLQFLDVLSKRDSFSQSKLNHLGRFMQVIRSTNATATVQDGFLSAAGDHISVFCKTECENISLFIPTLSYLLKNAENFFRYQNYIVGLGDGSAIVALGSRAVPSLDLEYIKKLKSSYRAKVDFSPVCILSKKSPSAGLAVLDLDLNRCIMKDENEKLSFSTKLSVSEKQQRQTNVPLVDEFALDFSEEVAKVERIFPVLQIPVKLFKDHMSFVENTAISVEIKRDVVLFNANDLMYFVVGRAEHAV